MDATLWTIKAALDWTEGYLRRKGDTNPRLAAQWLLGEACQLSRLELYTHFDQPLSSQERGVLRDFVARRGKAEPLQYITGSVAFRQVVVRVRPGALIPRPETEIVVGEALDMLASIASSSACRQDVDPTNKAEHTPGVTLESLVADIGTGSGCIACSLAFEHPLVRVIATDVADEAVNLATENAAQLGLSERIAVMQGDWGDAVPSELVGSFDLVVSNPPYIPSSLLKTLSPEVVCYEPTLALDGGLDGLASLRHLLPWCARALKPGGGFVFELHETCLNQAADMACQAGFQGVDIRDDLSGRPRILRGYRSE